MLARGAPGGAERRPLGVRDAGLLRLQAACPERMLPSHGLSLAMPPCAARPHRGQPSAVSTRTEEAPRQTAVELSPELRRCADGARPLPASKW